MDNNSGIRKNPSRETCESTIKRILITEYLEHGKNTHFRYASDFMSYFESLYPASDSLYKQVQRAIKSLNMPKDEDGYYIVNKTTEQMEKENDIKHIFNQNNIAIHSLDDCEPLLLEIDPKYAKYLITLIHECETFNELYKTIVEVYNGIIIYTKSKEKLIQILNQLNN